MIKTTEVKVLSDKRSISIRVKAQGELGNQDVLAEHPFENAGEG